jgi:uncharacterized Fe-S cluster-containing radical SAM superfamily protein
MAHPIQEKAVPESPTLDPTKFNDPDVTAGGATRAWVSLRRLETLCSNTGTLCNLTCANCYIESSPTNDRFVYITADEVAHYLDEIERDQLGTQEIAFTGGEPFMNPEFLPMIRDALTRGFSVLILTNAMKPMMRHADAIRALREEHRERLRVRVSADHYTRERHEEERGPKSWEPMLVGLKWLSENNFNLSVAGRTYWGESEAEMRTGFATLFDREGVSLDTSDPNQLVLFPEMDDTIDVPEITTDCWSILNLSPDAMMCATSRMVVKRKGNDSPTVLSCTLLPYDERFELGTALAEAAGDVKLNHPHCAKFCVLGGASCSG